MTLYSVITPGGSREQYVVGAELGLTAGGKSFKPYTILLAQEPLSFKLFGNKHHEAEFFF